jgi:hypothetical protein
MSSNPHVYTPVMYGATLEQIRDFAGWAFREP